MRTPARDSAKVTASGVDRCLPGGSREARRNLVIRAVDREGVRDVSFRRRRRLVRPVVR